MIQLIAGSIPVSHPGVREAPPTFQRICVWFPRKRGTAGMNTDAPGTFRGCSLTVRRQIVALVMLGSIPTNPSGDSNEHSIP